MQKWQPNLNLKPHVRDQPWPSSLRTTPCQYRIQPYFRSPDPQCPRSLRRVHSDRDFQSIVTETQGERERTLLLSLSWRWTLLTAASRAATQRCFSLKLVVIRYRYLEPQVNSLSQNLPFLFKQLTRRTKKPLTHLEDVSNLSDLEYINEENTLLFFVEVQGTLNLKVLAEARTGLLQTFHSKIHKLFPDFEDHLFQNSKTKFDRYSSWHL